ncbi:hypothetical protein CSE16_10730 [Solibacillus sp. R5-41]|uniref:DUF6891 domain-containing protein n=1 Tax=Solibacillus sp. R5-41 TaxID=2048654 RepID=UPI000C1258DD|nr:hypothetical protein [Solibacillus sp. R5-41]ATP40483.1 hypothetical protein CSE16_10730 [Solibacillus sp. R5-41]
MEWKKLLDECCANELEGLITDNIKAGFLSNEEIQEECKLYIEDNYPDDEGKIIDDDFSAIIAELRDKFQNVGTQENFMKLDLAFDNMEKRGVVTKHCAGYTLSDGFDDCNEYATECYEKGEKIVGCCFYTMQDLEHIFHDDTTVLYFAFGNYFDKPTAEEIGQIIVEELEITGFSIKWNGSADERIAITNLVWDKKYH